MTLWPSDNRSGRQALRPVLEKYQRAVTVVQNSTQLRPYLSHAAPFVEFAAPFRHAPKGGEDRVRVQSELFHDFVSRTINTSVRLPQQQTLGPCSAIADFRATFRQEITVKFRVAQRASAVHAVAKHVAEIRLLLLLGLYVY